MVDGSFLWEDGFAGSVEPVHKRVAFMIDQEIDEGSP